MNSTFLKTLIFVFLLSNPVFGGKKKTDEFEERFFEYKVIDGKLKPGGRPTMTLSEKSENAIIAEYIRECQALCITSNSLFQPCMYTDDVADDLKDLKRSDYEVYYYMCVKQTTALAGAFVSQFRDKKLTKKPLKESKFLTTLILYKLGITDVDEYIVDEMENLLELRIEYNDFSVLHKKTFHGARNLNKISLQGNGIAVIDDGAFNDLLYLKSIDLSHNELKTINWKLFSDAKSLHELRLNNNNLINIAVDVPPGWSPSKTEIVHCKDTLVEVRELHLQHNELSTINPLLLLRVPNLEVLDFANNSIKSIDGKLFENMEYIRVLNISNNRLRIPRPSWYRSLKSGDSGEQVILNLLGNEWRCDCDILDYYEFYMAKEEEFHKSLEEEKAKKALNTMLITCYTPPALNDDVLNNGTVRKIKEFYGDCGDNDETTESTPRDESTRPSQEKGNGFGIFFEIPTEYLPYVSRMVLAIVAAVTICIVARNNRPRHADTTPPIPRNIPHRDVDDAPRIAIAPEERERRLLPRRQAPPLQAPPPQAPSSQGPIQENVVAENENGEDQDGVEDKEQIQNSGGDEVVSNPNNSEENADPAPERPVNDSSKN